MERHINAKLIHMRPDMCLLFSDQVCFMMTLMTSSVRTDWLKGGRSRDDLFSLRHMHGHSVAEIIAQIYPGMC